VRISKDQKKRAAEAIARCQKLATFSETEGGTCRRFLSPPVRHCHREIEAWLRTAGAEVRVDAAGNLRGVYAAARTGGGRLLIGSHLDTVPNAGAYDGVLGVMIAVALIEELGGERLPFAIEVVGFSEEEGVRFGTPFIGSRALAGRLDDGLLSLRDGDGVSVREAIENFGLRADEISQAALSDDTFAYVEFHIEQGPVLESLERPLGVVEAIVGQTRMDIVFRGQANHAGTTPMHLRHDAMAATAEWMVAMERTTLNDSELLTTVGRLEARPGATNVIAGQVRATVDVRHRLDEVRRRAVTTIGRSAEEIAARRGVTVDSRVLLDQPAVAMDGYLTGQIKEAIRGAGCEPHRMVSGAGHDAMILAEKVPVGMIFLRTPGGISHDPAEAVKVLDVEKAIECGMHLLDQLARSSEVQERMSGA
jgi:allantoate deiminase